MPYPITIPFYGFRLHLPGGGNMLSPLGDLQTIRFTQQLAGLAAEYRDQLQREMLNEGIIEALLEEQYQGSFMAHQLRLTLPEARDKISHPAVEIEFDYFVNEVNQGYWGILPALGLEGYGETPEALAENLEETIRLHFVKDRRAIQIRDVLPAIWYEQIELLQQDMPLEVPNPKEVDELDESSAVQLLPRVATALQLETQQAFGRKAELQQLQAMLRNKFGRNVLLVGPSGVGKTALVWEIARRKTALRIKGEIRETTASTMIKELSGDTGWQDTLSLLCKELQGRDDLLYVRNLMDLFEVGKYEGNEISVAEYLLPYISRGEISMISECTEEELATIEMRSPSYLGNFQLLRLETPPPGELEKIIVKSIQKLARHESIQLPEAAIREVIRLNQRFTPYAGMPGKPIRFLQDILLHQRPTSAQATLRLEESEIIRYFCQDSGMPQFMIDPALPVDPVVVRSFFDQRLYGQSAAVESVVDILVAVKTALQQTGRPIASFLFVGPTGVGKTELAKVLAEFMFSDRNRMIRFDMSEYSSYYSVLRLTGVGHQQDGTLTTAVRQHPFCVLLFDEIEKAHHNFNDLLLQILGEGRLTDSRGKIVNFCSTIIIMTSNIGADKYQRGSISWQRELDVEAVDQHFIKEVEQYFRPEMYNRIDRIIPFRPLPHAVVRHIVDREIELLRKREGIRFRRLELTIQDEVKDRLADLGYDEKYGARQLQRVIRQHLIIPIAEQLNTQDVEEQISMQVSLKQDRILVHTVQDPLGLELLIEELERNSYADYASALRRQMSQLQESPVFIRIKNELDQLERSKQRSETEFWKNTQQARRYTAYLEILAKATAMKEEIEAHEMQLSLACLSMDVYNPAVQQVLQDWDQRLLVFKQELLYTLQPHVCYLSIYGRYPEQVLRFYLELCRHQKLTYKVDALWFSESYYQEVVEEEDPKTGSRIQRPRQAYKQKRVKTEPEDRSFSGQKGEELFGFIVHINGLSAHLYFSQEAGIQLWQDDTGEEHLYEISSGTQAPTVPNNIHRHTHYQKQSPRRVITPHTIKDTVYRLNREYNKGGELIKLLQEELDYRLRNLIESELME